jgi:hypothetical protein
MDALRWIYLTFSHWEVQAALDISDIQPLKVKALKEESFHTLLFPNLSQSTE